MWCSVVLLRKKGLRLRQPELGPPIVGDVRITDAQQTNFRRPLTQATIWLPSQASVAERGGPRIFDVEVVQMTGDSFSLCGIELEASEGRVHEYVQVWRCTPQPRR